MACFAFATADVSHLSGYQYANPGSNSFPLEYSTVHIPANYNSYIPPASGNPTTNSAQTAALSQQPQQPSIVQQAPFRQTPVQQAPIQQAPIQQAPVQQAPVQQAQYQHQNQAQYQHQNQAQQQPATQQRYSSGSVPSVSAYQQQQTSYKSSAQTGFQQTYSSQSQAALPPIVSKHVYAFAAPEDPEERAGPRYVQVGRARKNYKVIFIKAPTYGQSPIIPVLPQNEDKTIVYVLSKKPSEQEIQLPEPPVTQPSKPEVYFLKYKTQQEAEQAQQQIQGNRIGLSLKQLHERIKQLFLHAIPPIRRRI